MVFQMRILNVHIFFSRNRKVLVNGSLYRITFSIVIFTNTETTLDEQKLKEALEIKGNKILLII